MQRTKSLPESLENLKKLSRLVTVEIKKNKNKKPDFAHFPRPEESDPFMELDLCKCVFNSSISKVLAEDSFLFALFPSPEAASEVKITKTP